MQTTELRQEGILSNNAYDLMTQIVEENKSLWRIKNNYKSDASDDNEVREFWTDLEKDKQNHIRRLTELLSKRISKQ